MATHRIVNANVYCGGNNLVGQVEEFTLPDVPHKFVDHKAMGMIGSTKYWAGIDVMEVSIKFNSFYDKTFQKIADPFTPVQLQFRTSIAQYTASAKTGELPHKIFITGIFMNYPLGGFKAQDNVEYTAKLTVTRVKVETNGIEQMEYDYHANIYSILSVDQMAQYRANLGL